jgi:hypothetical protein
VPAASLRALLAHLIDYAGLFPPASLSLAETAAKYTSHLASPESWILNRIVLPTTELIEEEWRVTLLTDTEPMVRPPQIETFETKQPQKLSLPTYCEVAIDQVPAGAFAKIRTTGIAADEAARFLVEAAARRLAFKATAGLHHAIRSEARGMHGFINFFVAAGFAFYGAPREVLIDILEDEEAHAFAFHESEARWRTRVLTTSQVEKTRREFAHSFGSCSFDEPVADLRKLGWLA